MLSLVDPAVPCAFDRPVNICPIEPDAEPAAHELASVVNAEVSSLARLAHAEREVVILCGLATSDWNPAWRLVWLGRIAAPIAFTVGVSRWPTEPQRCDEAVLFENPEPGALLDAFHGRRAIFLHSHGRADALLLRGGRVCGGPRRGGSDELLANAPACAVTGTCYRDGTVAVSSAPQLLFTNACESIVIGRSSAMHPAWSVSEALALHGLRTLIGTPGYRHGQREEIVMAMALFRAGLPAWQVVRAVNQGLRAAGAQWPSLVLSGDPFVAIARPSAPTAVSIDPGIASCEIPITAGSSVAVQLPSPGWAGWSVESKQGSACAIPVGDTLWLAGDGRVVVHAVASEDRPQAVFERELARGEALAGGLAIAGRDNHDSALATELSQIERAAFALRPRLAISPDAAHKLVELTANLASLRRKRQRNLVTRLARSIGNPTRGHLCLTDLVDRNLAKHAIQPGDDCPDCGAASAQIEYAQGWHGELCMRCGLRSVRSGPPLVEVIELPTIVASGARVVARVRTAAECWAAGVLRGEGDGVCSRTLEPSGVEIAISAATPPHFFSFKVYASSHGELEAVTRRFRVLPPDLVRSGREGLDAH